MTYFIINDNSAGQLAVELQPDRSGGAMIGVLADQTVPANSPKASSEQKKLREWAKGNQIPFAYGRVVTGALTAGDDSAGFGWKIGPGDLVAATVPEVYGAGGCGAAGLCLGAEEFACALKGGSLPERKYLDNPEAQFKKITVCGTLKDGVMVSDAAEAACRSLRNLEHKELTVLLAGGPAMDDFSREERAVFCQRLGRMGFMTVTYVGQNDGAGDNAADDGRKEEACRSGVEFQTTGWPRNLKDIWNRSEPLCCLDLETVIQVMAPADLATAPVTPVTAPVDPQAVACVYIGGMGGFLSDIRLAAEMLAGNHIAEGVRLLLSPASADIYCEAADAGYLAVIMEAGGMILNQCAGPAVQGRIGENEVMVSNDCHDEIGYAGPESSRVILVSTRTAVSCALTGRMGKEKR